MNNYEYGTRESRTEWYPIKLCFCHFIKDMRVIIDGMKKLYVAGYAKYI